MDCSGLARWLEPTTRVFCSLAIPDDAENPNRAEVNSNMISLLKASPCPLAQAYFTVIPYTDEFSMMHFHTLSLSRAGSNNLLASAGLSNLLSMTNSIGDLPVFKDSFAIFPAFK